METVRIRDPGWKKVGSGIRDKHPGSATLLKSMFYLQRAADGHAGHGVRQAPRRGRNL